MQTEYIHACFMVFAAEIWHGTCTPIIKSIEKRIDKSFQMPCAVAVRQNIVRLSSLGMQNAEIRMRRALAVHERNASGNCRLQHYSS